MPLLLRLMRFFPHEYTTSEIEIGCHQYGNNCARCLAPDGDYITDDVQAWLYSAGPPRPDMGV
jgi:hypothetical protein